TILQKLNIHLIFNTLLTHQSIQPYLHPFFFFNDTATTEIYTLSLHDDLPISRSRTPPSARTRSRRRRATTPATERAARSEEHTSELQSHLNLVCSLLLEKKNKNYYPFVFNMIKFYKTEIQY